MRSEFWMTMMTIESLNLTWSVETEGPDTVRAVSLAHVSPNQTFGPSDPWLPKRTQALDISLETGEEEIVGTGKAEGCVNGIKGGSLVYSVGCQVPDRVRGRGESCHVVRSHDGSFVVNSTSDDSYVSNLAFLEQPRNCVSQGHVVNHRQKSS